MKLNLEEYLETGMLDLEEESVSYGELAQIDNLVHAYKDDPAQLREKLEEIGVELIN